MQQSQGASPFTTQQGMTTMRILWGALFFSVLLLGFVSYQRKGDFVFEGVQPHPGILGVALVALLLSFVIPRMMLLRAKASLPGNAEFAECVRRYMAPFIIRMALAEMVAQLGLVAATISEFNVSAPFIAAAGVRMIFAFPTEEKIRDVFSKFE